MADIDTYLINIRTRVEQELDHLLPNVKIAPIRLHEAMRYSVFAGGKRFRPALCIASCEAVGGMREEALLAACAIESLHTYTLIHDDLPAMDDDDIRRGKPSNHKAFDEGTAILAGDALLTIAFEWLGRTGNARFSEELAHAAGSLGTVGGQADDLDSKNKTVSPEELLSMHKRKTAVLFRVACRMGGIAARASEEQIDALGIFGEHLGLAFQLLDDVCDNDPITMNVLERAEVISLAHQHEKLSYDALTHLDGDFRMIKDIAKVTYASFVI